MKKLNFIFFICITLWYRMSLTPADAQTHQWRVFGYYQIPLAGNASIESLKTCKSVLTDLSPTVIEITDSSGSIAVHPETEFLDEPMHASVQIAPLIRNLGFDKKIAKWMLLSPSAQKRVITGVLDLLQKQPKYSGIVVDIENTSPGDRCFYSEFIGRLSDSLHDRGYKVYCVVGPKKQDLPGVLWVQAFDYQALGKCSDLVILMTYNHHWRGGPPGPIGTLNWFTACVEYAVKCIPPEKVIIGIPFYGFDWPEKGPATELTYKMAAERITKFKPNVQWHEQWATPWFDYMEHGERHEVWFEDVRSLEAKLQVCRKLGVGGIATWRLGDEDPRFWQVIARYSK